MGRNYYRIDRDQSFLMPPSLREWLSPDDFVWTVISAVEEFDMSAFDAKHRSDGIGHPAFPPRMVLALLVYCYANGERSSRRIEDLTRRDVACRVICSNRPIDYSTISLFRQRHEEALAGVFEQVLAMCARSGMVKAGVVALDGSKIEANAALAASKTGAGLRDEVGRILAEAAATDAAEDRKYGTARGNEVPEALANPATRSETIRKLLAEIRLESGRPELAPAREIPADRKRRPARPSNDPTLLPSVEASDPTSPDVPASDRHLARQLERAGQCLQHIAEVEAKRAKEAERKREERVRKEAAKGGPLRGRKPKAHPVEKPPKANLTDPDSRIMKSARGFLQGFNAQAVADENQVVIAADVVTDCNDQHQLHPMLNQALDSLKQAGVSQPPRVLLADAGYFSAANLKDASKEGPELIIAPGKRDATVSAPPAPRGRIPKDLNPSQRMARKVRTKRGRNLYRRRGQIIEPVFGQIKDGSRARRFSRRGLPACRSEWKFLCAVHNLKKLHRLQGLPGRQGAKCAR